MPIIIDYEKGRDIHLVPLGDLHYGSKQFSMERFEAFKKSITPEKQIVLVGDLIDNGTRNSVGAACYEQSVSIAEQKDFIYEELKPFAENGQILCCVGGNHEKRSYRETMTDIMYDVMCRWRYKGEGLEDRYRPNMAFCILRIGHKETTNHELRPTYLVVVGHGVGGGMYIGSGANRLERFINVSNADLIISGHTHKPLTFPTSSLYIDTRNCQILEQQHTVVVCSSFMEYGGYPLEKMLPPTAKVSQEIILSAKGKHISVIQST